MNGTTIEKSKDQWLIDLGDLFDRLARAAQRSGWEANLTTSDITEQVFSLGGSFKYTAPVLVLTKSDPTGKRDMRVTFEPRYRFAVGAAGRIDVFAYPTLREAMLLRIADTTNSEKLTWDEAEERVAHGSWQAFSLERLRLSYRLDMDQGISDFLDGLVDPLVGE